MSEIEQWLKQYGGIAVVSAIVGAILTAILTKLIPYLWAQGGRLISRLGKILGGRFAYRDFEKRYLDWIVTELRELKLTGIVSYDDAKKPELEQVFVSLTVGEQREQSPLMERIEERAEIWDFDSRITDEYLEAVSRIRSVDLSGDVVETALREQARRILDLGTVFESDKPIYREAWLRMPRIITATLFSSIRNSLRRFFRISKRTEVETYTYRSWLEASTVRWQIYRSLMKADGAAQIKRILDKHPRIAILGVPGSGKTTLLQYVALAYARNRCGDSKLRRRGILQERLGTKKWRLPLFIPLSSVASALADTTLNGRDMSIVDVLPRILPPDFQKDYGDIASSYFSYQLRRGNCVVLLDGLDEVPTDAEFNAVVRAIESLALRYDKNLFIVTSRIAGWRSGVGADFNIFYVNDLTDDQINTFIGSWYSAVERNVVIGRLEDESAAERKARERRASQRSNDLKLALRENIGIRRLATNPMLLSIIALVHRSLATLPRERSKLYAECSKILLEQWDFSRGVRVDDTNLKLEQKEAIVRRIAVAFHTGEIGEKGGGREASSMDVQRIIAEMLPGLGRPPDDAARLLQRLIERSGMITERKRGVLAFAHLTFQEYFTARFLALGERVKHRDFLLSAEHLLSDWWREVILLYTGLLSDSSDFIRLIYDKTVDDLCQQRLRLAGLCLGEAVEIKKTEVRQSIVTELLKVRTRGEITQIHRTMPSDITAYLIRWSRGLQWYTNAALNRIRETGDRESLLVALDDQQSIVRRAALTAIIQFPPQAASDELVSKIASLVGDKDADTRCNAVEALGVVGRISSSESIEPCLINALREEDTRLSAAAAKSIEMLDRRVRIPSNLFDLHSMLENKDWTVRQVAARMFPLLDYAVTLEWFDRFIMLLTDNDSDVRGDAVQAFKKILHTTQVDSLIEKALDLLQHKYVSIRSTAAEALGELGADIALRHEVLDKLIMCLGDEAAEVQASGFNALKQLANKGLRDEITAKITQMLDAKDINVRVGAIRAIQKDGITPVPEGVFEKLLDASNASENNLRSAAASALVIADTATTRNLSVQKLMHLTRDKDTDVRIAALNALGSLGQDTLTEQVAGVITYTLDDKVESVRIAAATAIAKLGHKEVRKDVIDRLLKALEGGGIFQRSYRRVVQQFARRSTHSSLSSSVEFSTFQSAACYALTVVGIDTYLDRIIAGLRSVIYSKGCSNSIRLSALHTLAHLGTKTAPERIFDEILQVFGQKPELTMPFVQGSSPNVTWWLESILEAPRRRATVMENPLAIIGEHLPRNYAARKLATLVTHSHDSVRIMALQVLASLDGDIDVELITRDIEVALNDKELIVRLAAIQTVEKTMEKAPSEKLCAALARKLSDDNVNIQTGAWEVLAKSYKTLGIWI